MPRKRLINFCDIADFIKLDDDKLKGLITNVDVAGPGALITKMKEDGAMASGDPGDWNIASFDVRQLTHQKHINY